ncbi:hypothetical protein [Pontibacter rugosus]
MTSDQHAHFVGLSQEWCQLGGVPPGWYLQGQKAGDQKAQAGGGG